MIQNFSGDSITVSCDSLTNLVLTCGGVLYGSAIILPIFYPQRSPAIDLATVEQILQIFATTGDVLKRPNPAERVNEQAQPYIVYQNQVLTSVCKLRARKCILHVLLVSTTAFDTSKLLRSVKNKRIYTVQNDTI